MLVFEKKQANKLAEYKEKMESIINYYRNSKLKEQHKERLDYFAERTIKYCKTKKAVAYEKIGRNYKHSIPLTKTERGVYKNVLEKVKGLQKQIHDDKELKLRHKQELCRCLSFLVGHLTGKLQRNK